MLDGVAPGRRLRGRHRRPRRARATVSRRSRVRRWLVVQRRRSGGMRNVRRRRRRGRGLHGRRMRTGSRLRAGGQTEPAGDLGVPSASGRGRGLFVDVRSGAVLRKRHGVGSADLSEAGGARPRRDVRAEPALRDAVRARDGVRCRRSLRATSERRRALSDRRERVRPVRRRARVRPDWRGLHAVRRARRRVLGRLDVRPLGSMRRWRVPSARPRR